jgi:ribosomal protein S18 acetylase RimI-like enzyme
MISIKSFSKKDYKKVKEILQEADSFDKYWDSEKNILGRIKIDNDSVLIAIENNKIIGTISTNLFGPQVATIYRLVVKKEFRNKGIATLLIKHVESILKSKGVIEIGMYVNANKKELQEFYKKRNYSSSTNTPYIYMWNKLSK